MTNAHLFALINAGPGLDGWRRLLATGVGEWLIYLVPVGMCVGWMRGNPAERRDLLDMLVATATALLLAQLVAHIWPQPRPFMVHMGNQYLAHSSDSGMPSDHTTVLWSLGLSALMTRKYAVWGFPLLAAGVVVGWCRVYLGVHFPGDILAAAPVAVAGLGIARMSRGFTAPAVDRLLRLYNELESALLRRIAAAHRAD